MTNVGGVVAHHAAGEMRRASSGASGAVAVSKRRPQAGLRAGPPQLGAARRLRARCCPALGAPAHT